MLWKKMTQWKKNAQVKDNINLINDKEEEVSALKLQINKMRKDTIHAERIRKEQDKDTIMTDHYNDALSEYLLISKV